MAVHLDTAGGLIAVPSSVVNSAGLYKNKDMKGPMGPIDQGGRGDGDPLGGIPGIENVKVMLWFCPADEHHRVKWDGTTAICLDCGRTNEHEWFDPSTEYLHLSKIGESCRWCGVMRGKVSETRKCPGSVHIGLRKQEGNGNG